jgi:hypothetical protein
MGKKTDPNPRRLSLRGLEPMIRPEKSLNGLNRATLRGAAAKGSCTVKGRPFMNGPSHIELKSHALE